MSIHISRQWVIVKLTFRIQTLSVYMGVAIFTHFRGYLNTVLTKFNMLKQVRQFKLSLQPEKRNKFPENFGHIISDRNMSASHFKNLNNSKHCFRSLSLNIGYQYIKLSSKCTFPMHFVPSQSNQTYKCFNYIEPTYWLEILS